MTKLQQARLDWFEAQVRMLEAEAVYRTEIKLAEMLVMQLEAQRRYEELGK